MNDELCERCDYDEAEVRFQGEWLCFFCHEEALDEDQEDMW